MAKELGVVPDISIHTLTRRVTKKTSVLGGTVSISIHTLTRRVTRRLDGASSGPRNFNPHPHTEGDFIPYRLLWRHWQISIHTLTRRVTTNWTLSDFQFIISIHTLTRRVTVHL